MGTNHENVTCGYNSEHVVTHQCYTGDRSVKLFEGGGSLEKREVEAILVRGMGLKTEVTEQGERKKEMSQILYRSMTCLLRARLPVPARAC